MTNQESMHLTGILEEHIELTLEDLCRACAAHTGIIVELVEEGVLDAAGASPVEWRFDVRSMRRARVALRLQRDLGLNLAGAALALQLMEEIETLRARLRAMGGE